MGQSLFAKRPFPLKPFLFRIREGYLLGLAMDPQKGSPCKTCVQKWMEMRGVFIEPADLSELTVRRDLIADLLADNSPHTLYEISLDGTVVRMDSLVFPHPECVCERLNYVPPQQLGKNTNFAFSPLTRIHCTRFGCPDGNLWLSQVEGESPETGESVSATAVDRDREVSRFKAVDTWLKMVLSQSASRKLKRGEAMASEVLQSGQSELLSSASSPAVEAMGIGKNREEATLQGLMELAKRRTLKGYASSLKSPMLVVGANNWIRTRVPFFLLQQYDLHLLFYPNSNPAWVVGLAAVSRQNTDEKPTFVFSAHWNIQTAVDELFCKILEVLRPEATDAGGGVFQNPRPKATNSQINLWWNHWIYRCPKITLKDVLQLEDHSNSIEQWRDYFRDGHPKVSVIYANQEGLPAAIRAVVKIRMPASESVSNVRNINGIGTPADFSDAL